MIEILSLPRRPKETNVDLSKYKLKSGLPLNSLPGWEHIPLNSKLPMLKCPDNHVIFTKNKIGQAIKNIRYVISMVIAQNKILNQFINIDLHLMLQQPIVYPSIIHCKILVLELSIRMKET